MKIEKQNGNLVVTIPLMQPTYDALGECQGSIDNIVGIIDGDRKGFAHVIDLGYKGTFDYTDIFLEVYFSEDEFTSLCKELGIILHKYTICSKCDKPIYGSYTYNEGPICFECEQILGIDS